MNGLNMDSFKSTKTNRATSKQLSSFTAAHAAVLYNQDLVTMILSYLNLESLYDIVMFTSVCCTWQAILLSSWSVRRRLLYDPIPSRSKRPDWPGSESLPGYFADDWFIRIKTPKVIMRNSTHLDDCLLILRTRKVHIELLVYHKSPQSIPLDCSRTAVVSPEPVHHAAAYDPSIILNSYRWNAKLMIRGVDVEGREAWTSSYSWKADPSPFDQYLQHYMHICHH
jgi:hypothetical protein